MTDLIHIPNDHGFESTQNETLDFKYDVKTGLEKYNKQILSKYFYDDCGSDLFNQITRHPDYYLTRCEAEILSTYKHEFINLFTPEPFNLVELGPGEAIKTQILLRELLLRKIKFNYIPIDISTKYLKNMLKAFKQQLPEIKLLPLHADYFCGLEWLSKRSKNKNVVLFLGSSIGNFDQPTTEKFLIHLWKSLNKDDYVLLGFDLRKDVNILMRAYDDDEGITSRFNLNLLKRINRELSGNFQLDKFHHYATYNVYSGAMESYLISLEKQNVFIKDLNKTYFFNAIEAIHVENSFKYILAQINELANKTGFKLIETFMDKKQHFADTLWRVIK